MINQLKTSKVFRRASIFTSYASNEPNIRRLITAQRMAYMANKL